MGGCGSGGWNRTARSTTEDLRRISIQSLLRDRVLDGPRSITTTWSRNGEKVASIGIVGGRNAIRLHYRHQGYGETEWRSVDETVRIDWRPNRYGGATPYFECPRCKRSVWHLYLTSGYNLCRHCCRLTYESRRQRSYDRMAETVHRLRMKLGGEPGFDQVIPDKPKGMHWRTYNGTCARIHAMERASWDRAAVWLGRLEARIGKGRRRGMRPGGFWT